MTPSSPFPPQVTFVLGATITVVIVIALLYGFFQSRSDYTKQQIKVYIKEFFVYFIIAPFVLWILSYVGCAILSSLISTEQF